MNRVTNSLDTVARTSANLSSTISGITGSVFKVKLFFIVGITMFLLGLGLGLTTGVYWGYKKWTKKVDTLIEQSKEYRKEALDKVKEKIKERL